MRLKVVSYLLLLALKLSVWAQLPVREVRILNPLSKQSFRRQMGTWEWLQPLLSDCPLSENYSVPITSASIFVLLGWSHALTVFEDVYIGIVSRKISDLMGGFDAPKIWCFLIFDREILWFTGTLTNLVHLRGRYYEPFFSVLSFTSGEDVLKSKMRRKVAQILQGLPIWFLLFTKTK